MEAECVRCMVNRGLGQVEISSASVAKLLNGMVNQEAVGLREAKHDNRETQQVVRSMRLLLQATHPHPGPSCDHLLAEDTA